ncbi:MAG: hypothetical protein OXH02_01625 [Gemmatimonadetes bacterium]|nr:hypothetical protein [Gemmatimonadota bacterium]
MRQAHLLLLCGLLAATACDDAGPTKPVLPAIEREAQRVTSALENRSFRRFHPSRDAPERRAVIIDFFASEDQAIGLWAQYGLNDTALVEWEVSAGDYSVEKSGSVYTLVPIKPSSSRSLPEPCEDCIPVSGLSISVRNLFNGGNIQFKLNNAGNRLPLPFPVFSEWSAWSEDEYFDG